MNLSDAYGVLTMPRGAFMLVVHLTQQKWSDTTMRATYTRRHLRLKDAPRRRNRSTLRGWLERFRTLPRDKVNALLRIDRDALRTTGYVVERNQWIERTRQQYRDAGLSSTEKTASFYRSLAEEMKEYRAAEIWSYAKPRRQRSLAGAMDTRTIRALLRGRRSRDELDREPIGRDFLRAGFELLDWGQFRDASKAFARAEQLGSPVPAARHLKLARAVIAQRRFRAIDVLSYVARHRLYELVPICLERAVTEGAQFSRLSRYLDALKLQLNVRQLRRLQRRYEERGRWMDAAEVLQILSARSAHWRERAAAYYRTHRARAVTQGELNWAMRVAELMDEPLTAEELFRMAVITNNHSDSERALELAAECIPHRSETRKRR